MWVVASDYSEDLKIDKAILNQHAESYRKIRNTLRFLLGNLNDKLLNDDFSKIEYLKLSSLEKYVLMLILSLITLVASMNMVSLLSMYIHQKRKIFALCIVMGMSTARSSALIIIMGMLIASSASFIGLFAAYLAGIFLQNYPLIKLPDAYYVTELPVELDLNVFLFIGLATLFISFIASWIPARKISMLPISDILRSEE